MHGRWFVPGLLLSFALFIVACGGAHSSSPPITITVTPASTSVTVSTAQSIQTAQFTVRVSGTSSAAVNWEVNGTQGGNPTVGTITASGLYTSPMQIPSPPTETISAVLQSDTTKSGSATAKIIAAVANQNTQSAPIKLGSSGSNAKDSSTSGNTITCCGGTLGSLVERDGTFFVLGNTHVLARTDLAAVGESIIQPGLVDANCSAAGTLTVAHLSQFTNLEATGVNADAAIAQIVPGEVDTSGTILSLGATTNGTVADAGPPHAGSGITPTLGMSVAKSGRSTGLTCSTISATNLSASIQYRKGCGTGTMFTVTYSNQIAVAGGTFSAEGDSGSLIVSQTTADPVALLYGASDSDTVGNPVADVLNALLDTQGNLPSFVGSAPTHAVIGCTLAAQAQATQAQAAQGMQGQATGPQATPRTVPEERLAKADGVRDAHANELLANPRIRALGTAASLDAPGEASILIFIDDMKARATLPQTLEGVRTRVQLANAQTPRRTLSREESATLAPNGEGFSVGALAELEMNRAKAVHASHVGELMAKPGIQGAGITSSADAPGEAAIVVYVIQGMPHEPIPPVIDGVRTRIRESSRFLAGFGDSRLPNCFSKK
jgi:hypothetical protein